MESVADAILRTYAFLTDCNDCTFHVGRLLQHNMMVAQVCVEQYMVDAWTCVEQNRLHFFTRSKLSIFVFLFAFQASFFGDVYPLLFW